MIGGIADAYWQQILSLFVQHPNIAEVILYGSRAKGNFHNGSDIDVALKGRDIASTQLTQIWDAYDRLYLPWKLDLTVYDTIAHAELKDHIDRVGVSIHRA